MHYTPDMAAKITNVCAALHNICIHFKMDVSEVDVVTEIPTTNSEANDDPNAKYLSINFKNDGIFY